MTGFEPARTDRQSAMLPDYITSPCQCAGQELNLQSSKAGGLQPLGPANAQPTHESGLRLEAVGLRPLSSTSSLGSQASRLQVAREGVEPTNDHEGLSFAALPVCVPCRFRLPASGSRPQGIASDLRPGVWRLLPVPASPDGFEPTASTLTGWRALRTAPRGQCC